MRFILSERFWFVHIPLGSIVKFDLLHNSQWTSFSIQSCLVFYWLCASFLYSFIMLLALLFLPSHYLQLLFCCILWSFVFIWLVFMTLFCATINSNSVSLLRLPFRCHVQVVSCADLLFNRLKYSYSCFSSHFCFLVVAFFLLCF